MNPDELHSQTREQKYCEEHELLHVKNALGDFVCPFCRSNIDQ
jgi:hypothetical protein